MGEIDKSHVIPQLDALRTELQAEPPSKVVKDALHQCERLHQAVLQSHAEGLRFAAFTLTRLMQQPGANLRESTLAAARALSQALGTAGHSH